LWWLCWKREKRKRRKLWMIGITWTNWKTYQETTRDELVLRGERMLRLEIDHRGRNRTTERNGDIPLGYSGWTALRREQCDSMPETLVTNYKQQIATQRSKLFLQ
jgi:hypothetical protein